MQGNVFLWSLGDGRPAYSIYYEENGSGSHHVLMVHGMGGNCYTFHTMAQDLAKQGFHIWTIDLLGFGQSSKPLDVPYSFDLFAAILQDFLHKQGVKRVHYIGHSMGGGVGLTLAAKHMLEFSSLTLIASAGLPFKIPVTLLSPLRVMARLPQSALRQVVKEALTWLAYDTVKVTGELVDACYTPLSLPPGPLILFSVLKAFKNTSLEKLSQQLGLIDTPTLIIWGKEDRLIPVEHAAIFQRHLRSCSLRLFERCGHLIPVEKPAELTHAVLEFLDEQQKRGA